jgi:23S rRNA (uracil1939-C5)-methyltransferase
MTFREIYSISRRFSDTMSVMEKKSGNMKKNDRISIKIDSFKTLNRTLGYYENTPVFISGGMPGQRAEVLIKRKRQSVCEAAFVKLLEAADYEIPVSCPVYGQCGGCSFLSMPYAMQLQAKEDYILQLLQQHGFSFQHYRGIHPSPQTEGYRNKMEFSFGNAEKGGALTLGMHRRNSFFDIVPALDCQLIDDDFQAILKAVVRHCQQKNYSFYHKRAHRGLLRHLVLRKGCFTGQIMVNIITSSQAPFDEEAFVEAVRCLPLTANIVSVLHTVNDSVADTVAPEEVRLLAGQDYLDEQLLSLTFQIAPFAFFQTNSAGCEILYRQILDMLPEAHADLILDLYCGTGTIAQLISPKADQVIGVELVQSAVAAAEKNAERNNLANCHFIAGDVLNVLPDLLDIPDVIILDPPRAGIHPAALAQIAAYRAKYILYVSCNPTALIKDLALLTKTYDIADLSIVDMFPHTPHVECVTLMSKVEK